MMPTEDRAWIAERLACCTDDLDRHDRRMQLALLRLLAQGEPVEASRLAGTAQLDAADAVARVRRWQGVHTDERGRVVAFNGLSVANAPHVMQVDGCTLYAWCAWDTLFLPELIGHPAEIESICPTTGEPISLRVGAEGPTDVSPAPAVLSLLVPSSGLSGDVIESFCRFVHFFASPGAAEEWGPRHPEILVTSIEAGFEIGRHANAARFGDALASPGSGML